MTAKILIIDDDLDTLRLVGLMLERQGYEILAANNGKQGLEAARLDQPDLILLDVMMPDLDGFEVTRLLRDDPATTSIPIILFTAKTQVEDRVTGLEAGADVYLTKPTQPRELFAQVKAMLARRPKIFSKSEDDGRDGHLIGVISARGGMGVSTIAINLGISIRKITQSEVNVAEFNPGYGALSIDLGHTQARGIERLLENTVGEITKKDIEIEFVTDASGTKLLLSSIHPINRKYQAKPEVFAEIARGLSGLGKFSVIDLGSSLSPIAQSIVQKLEMLIIVVGAWPQSVTQTKVLLDDLNSIGFREDKAIFVLNNRIRTSVQLNWNEVEKELERKITTVFTPVPELSYQAAINNTALITQQPESVTAQQYEKLAKSILQQIQ